ncbi:peptidase inhibitor family I36 protein [Xylanimonas cellulosilytica]|uniref:peptidase inhibitor family I36 protein n=1 Tax=Xylanimonas cellulosilytica TaxID=186189 RepID=UPI0009D6941B
MSHLNQRLDRYTLAAHHGFSSEGAGQGNRQGRGQILAERLPREAAALAQGGHHLEGRECDAGHTPNSGQLASDAARCRLVISAHARRLRGAAALVLATTVLGPVASASATEIAPTSSAQCATGKFCLWSGAAYTGTFFAASSSVDVQGLSAARAVWNRSNTAVRVYTGAGGSGSYSCFAAGTQIASTTLTAGSIRVQSSTAC